MYIHGYYVCVDVHTYIHGYYVCMDVHTWVLCVGGCTYMGTMCGWMYVHGYYVCMDVYTLVLCVRGCTSIKGAVITVNKGSL